MSARLKLIVMAICFWTFLAVSTHIAASADSLLFIRMPDEAPIDHEPTDAEIERFVEIRGDYLDMTVQELKNDSEFARQVLGQNQVFIELSEFHTQHRIHAKVKFIAWPDAFLYFKDYVSVPENSIAVVQLGDTWEAYFHSLGVIIYSQRLQFDVRMLWYWKDLVSPEEIADGDGFVSVCRQLRKTPPRNADLIAPFAIPTAPDWDLLHNFAIWLYNAGLRNLVSTHKKFNIIPWKEAVFASQEGERAVEFLINLAEQGYIDLPDRNNVQVTEDFLEKKYAMVIMPPWVAWRAATEIGPEWQSQIGATLPPTIGANTATTFKGGSLLVVLDPSRGKDSSGIEKGRRLVDFLCSTENMRRYTQVLGALPGNPQVLAESPYFELFEPALNQGKSYPAIPEWAPVVENLATRDSLYALWKRISALTDSVSYQIKNKEEQAARKKLIFAALHSAEVAINKELSPGQLSSTWPWLLTVALLAIVAISIYLWHRHIDRKRIEELKRERVKLANLQRQMALRNLQSQQAAD